MRDLTHKELNLVKEILDNFEYKRVRKTMKKLGWFWYDSTDTPTKERIRGVAESLLISAILSDAETFRTACGGLEVIKLDGFVSLTFIVGESGGLL